jgi:DNA-binding NarL/FixJ family response regulator
MGVLDMNGLSIQVVVRSPDRLMRESLVSCLGSKSGIEVVGASAGLHDLLELCRLRPVDVALVEVGQAQRDEIDHLALLRTTRPTLCIVLVYAELSAADVVVAAKAGISALVPHQRGLAAVMAAIAAAPVLQSPTQSETARLTDGDMEILALMSAGYNVREIAELLGIATSTVENHKRRIFAKLDVHSQIHALARATRVGLTWPPAMRVIAHPRAVRSELTSRELDILRSIARGDSVRQTASSLGISVKTVENTQARLFRKLGVRNRAEALLVAYELGVVSAE